MLKIINIIHIEYLDGSKIQSNCQAVPPCSLHRIVFVTTFAPRCHTQVPWLAAGNKKKSRVAVYEDDNDKSRPERVKIPLFKLCYVLHKCDRINKLRSSSNYI